MSEIDRQTGKSILHRCSKHSSVCLSSSLRPIRAINDPVRRRHRRVSSELRRPAFFAIERISRSRRREVRRESCAHIGSALWISKMTPTNSSRFLSLYIYMFCTARFYPVERPEMAGVNILFKYNRKEKNYEKLQRTDIIRAHDRESQEEGETGEWIQIDLGVHRESMTSERDVRVEAPVSAVIPTGVRSLDSRVQSRV